MTKQIPLGQSTFALVDDADYDHLAQYEWFLSKTGYAVGVVPSDGKFQVVYMHRYLLNAPPTHVVDHINGNALDNRRENLRLATPRQNVQNKSVSPLSATGLKGVGWHKRRRKFHARIQLQGVRVHLGFFEHAKDAALAYDAAARALFGPFALCNYPEGETPRSVAVSVAQRLEKRGLHVMHGSENRPLEPLEQAHAVSEAEVVPA